MKSITTQTTPRLQLLSLVSAGVLRSVARTRRPHRHHAGAPLGDLGVQDANFIPPDTRSDAEKEAALAAELLKAQNSLRFKFQVAQPAPCLAGCGLQAGVNLGRILCKTSDPGTKQYATCTQHSDCGAPCKGDKAKINAHPEKCLSCVANPPFPTKRCEIDTAVCEAFSMGAKPEPPSAALPGLIILPHDRSR